MLDVKYYRDYRYNYLIIKDNGCLSENTYQRKMITENKIKGLLASQERYINGDILLYYDITSKQSFFSIFDGKSIGMEQLRKFFVQLKAVNEMLQKYLLDGNGLVLLPEYIFQNIETGEYFFLYYPDPEEGKFPQLIEFFIARVDNEDMKAVECVYKIADLIHRDQFVIDEILKWFQDDTENYADDMSDRREYQYQTEQDDNRFYKIENELSERKENGRKKKGICRIISDFFKKIRNKSKPENVEEGYRYMETGETIIPAITEPVADEGNTVFIPWTETCENKLYSMDRKNKCHIDLGRLPLTVGKLAGAVDMVINETSISRMHARFSRSGTRIYITDLNSTNGTFRNGMRLTPNASEIIEPGDEIRLGKLKFIYR